MRLFLCFLILLVPLAGYSEERRPPGFGGVFVGDLNGDGLDDSIRSGPELYFEKYGGPFLVTLASSEGEPQHVIIWSSASVFAYEQGYDGKWHRVWTVSGGPAGVMLVSYVNLSNLTDRGGFTMDDRGGETIESAKLFEAVFTDDNRLTMTYPDAYEPPELPDGMRWDQ